MTDLFKSSYVHQEIDDAACAICGRADRKLAIHVIRYVHTGSGAWPSGFIAQSAGVAGVHGGLPICDRCAPPCWRCRLPIATSEVRKAFEQLVGRYHTEENLVTWGEGRCPHRHIFRK